LFNSGEGQRCGVLRSCRENECCTGGLLLGRCSNGTEGAPCGGLITNCGCQDGFQCQGSVCRVISTSTTTESPTGPTTEGG